jgi:predicted nuclease of predicted toxin-antitoxin system
MPLLRFYTDSHVPKQVALQLRVQNIDVVRCQEIGLEDAEDIVHLEKATSQLRMVITGDADFIRLHMQWTKASKFHAGILYFQPETQGNIGSIVNAALFLFEAIELNAATLEDDVYNRLIFVERGSRS